jgi:hypothetical protein
MHSKVLPFSWTTAFGQMTAALRWRWVRMLCFMDAATRAVLRLVFEEVELVEEEFDEPHAPISAAAATAVTATVARRSRARGGMGVGTLTRMSAC